MNAADSLPDLLDGRSARAVEPGILSVLPPDAPGQRYDGRARAYDRIIGSRLYNRLFWGSSPDQYRAFALLAVASANAGRILDAGCGTMLLTARAYAVATERPVVALDQSLGMLRRARERLLEASREAAAEAPGEISGQAEHTVLLQADLLDLPFRAGTFQTVLCMGMLHLFDRPEPLLAALRRCLVPGGQVFVSSLVENARLGDRYMRFLHRAGELAAPRGAAELEGVLRRSLGEPTQFSVSGNMAFGVYAAS